MQRGSRIKVKTYWNDAGTVRSREMTGPLTLGWILWSIPKESRMPSCRKTAVRRAVPAKISTQKRLLASLPAKRFCTGEIPASAGECGCGGCHE